MKDLSLEEISKRMKRAKKILSQEAKSYSSTEALDRMKEVLDLLLKE